MHPDLSPHLHTEECNILVAAYKQCHVDHPFKKFLGACNAADRAMTKCLMAELEKKREANRKKSSINRKNKDE